MTEAEIETLRLPLSELRFQRRTDGRWRCVTPAQHDDEEAGLVVPAADEWIPADLPIGTQGRAERSPGLPPQEGWWVLYGDARARRVTVTLADGRTPEIVTFGPVWICEWVSTWQVAHVTVDDQSFEVFASPSRHLRDDSDR